MIPRCEMYCFGTSVWHAAGRTDCRHMADTSVSLQLSNCFGCIEHRIDINRAFDKARDLSQMCFFIYVRFQLSLCLPLFIYLFISILYLLHNGFGGLGVACWPLLPKFASSNPAEDVGSLGRKKSSARLPSEGK